MTPPPKMLPGLSMREVGAMMYPAQAAANPIEAARRARRRLKRRDPHGRWFVKRGTGKAARYRPTMEELLTHVPEMFPRRQQLAHIVHMAQDENKSAFFEIFQTLSQISRDLADIKKIVQAGKTRAT